MATQQHLLDDLLAQHPPGAIGAGAGGFGETAMRYFLNNAIALFCEEARLYRDVLTITTTADTTAYALGVAGSSVAVAVLRVTIPTLGGTYGTALVPRLMDPIEDLVLPSGGDAYPAVFYIRPGADGAYYLHVGTLGSRALVALPVGTAVEVHRVAQPAPLTDGTLLYADGLPVEDEDGNAVTVVSDGEADVLALPEPFHLAPVHYASAQLYLRRTDLSMPERIAMQRINLQEYRRLLRPARAYGEAGKSRGIHPRPYHY